MLYRVGLFAALVLPASLLAHRSLQAHNGHVAIARVVQRIEIDGRLEDWPSGLQRYEIEEHLRGRVPEGSADLSASYRVAASSDGQSLYVAVEVRDDFTTFDADGHPAPLARLRPRDCDASIVLLDFEHGEDRNATLRFESSACRWTADDKPAEPRIARVVERAVPGGYVSEWLLDLRALGREDLTESRPLCIGFDVIVQDRDEGKAGLLAISWGPGSRKGRTSRLGDLFLLAESAETGHIEGRLLSIRGDARRTVSVRSAEPADWSLRLLTEPDGAFRVELPAGSCSLRAESLIGWCESRAVDVKPGETVEVELQGASAPSLHPPRSSPARISETIERIATVSSGPWETVATIRELRGPVNALVEGPAGFLWIGTTVGLWRYDGQRFERIDSSVGPAHESIERLLTDRKGRVWIGSRVSTYVLEAGTLTRFARIPLASRSLAFMGPLGEDSGGLVWATQRTALFPLGAPTARSTVIDLPFRATSLLATEDGLLVGTARGLYRVVDGRAEPVVFPEPVDPPKRAGRRRVPSLAARSPGGAWMCYGGRLWIYSDGRAEAVDVGLAAADRHPLTRVLEDHQGSLWLGVRHAGLVEIRDGSLLRHGPELGIFGLSVRCIYEDRHGAIWIGTGAGLSRYSRGGSPVRVVTGTRGKPAGVQALAEDASGGLWVGTAGRGLLRYDGETVRPLDDAPDRLSQGIACLHLDRGGQLWIGTRQGLVRRGDEGYREWGEADGLIARDVRALAQAADESIWVGTARGVSAVRGDRVVDVSLHGPFLHCAVSAILVASSGETWFATPAGLYSWGGDGLRTFTTRDGLPDDEVLELCEGPSGAIWAGSRNGIACFDGDRFRVPDGDLPDLSDSRVHSLLVDRRGHLIIGTRFGVLRFDGQTSQRIPLGADWIDGSGVRDLLETREGDQWLGLFAGGAVRIPQGAELPAIDLIESRNEAERGRRFELEVSASSFAAFEFRGIDLSAGPAQLKYRHRLLGVEDDWTYGHEPRVEYANLAAGDYRFEVEAIDTELDVSPTLAVDVRVRRAWKELAIWGTLSLLGLLTLWLAIRLFARDRALVRARNELEDRVSERTHSLERTRVNLESARGDLRGLAARLITVQEEERRHLARELHDDLTQSLVSLGMEIELLRQASESTGAELDRDLAGLADRARGLAQRAGRMSRRLHPAILTDLGLVGAVEAECQAFERRAGIRVSCRAHLEKGLDADAALSIYRILQESLRNVEKHSGADVAKVRLSESAGVVELTVQDFGRGFEHPSDGGRGLGLTSMEERALLVGGHVLVLSSIGLGTSIELKVRRQIDEP